MIKNNKYFIDFSFSQRYKFSLNYKVKNKKMQKIYQTSVLQSWYRALKKSFTLWILKLSLAEAYGFMER
jgi:hypothetical protein